jgi:hypothetical protein
MSGPIGKLGARGMMMRRRRGMIFERRMRARSVSEEMEVSITQSFAKVGGRMTMVLAGSRLLSMMRMRM